MILSKPLRNALVSYLSNLYENPIRTKAITCCVIAVAGNLVSQWITSKKKIDEESLMAYGLYGLLFGGTVPHFYYNALERMIPDEAALSMFRRILFDRLVFTPLYQAFSLYMLGRLEKKSHDQAMVHLLQVYVPLLSANMKYLTILQLVNLTLVPPILRVLTMNLIGFFWVIYVAKMRSAKDSKGNSSK